MAFLAIHHLFPPPQVSGPYSHLGDRVEAPALWGQHCLAELAMTEGLCICAVQCSSHSLHVASATKELNLYLHLIHSNLNSHLWLLAITVDGTTPGILYIWL